MTNSIVIMFLIGLSGFILGMVYTYFMYFRKLDGIFLVNLTNPNEEMFKMQIDIPLEDLPNAKYLIFQVKKVQ